ncbi:M24 family metallopeptidase, partial [Gemmatimonadota bacterium]
MSFDILRTGARRSLPLIAILLLLPVDSLLAQIRPAEYAARRATLTQTLGDGLYYFRAEVASNGRQDPDFNYLTGITAPEARLMMVRQGEEFTDIIFLPGLPEAATGARSLEEFDTVLREALGSRPTRLITSLSPTRDEVVADLFEQLNRTSRVAPSGAGSPGLQIVNPAGTLRSMRGTKSPAERELLQIASDITRNAHIAAMRTADVGINEFELQAVIEYTFRRNGAERPGFDSIVGSGPNSLSLHWSDNNRFMEEGDVVVMDIGAEYFGYTSDVTRTIPVSGTFTREQRDIYEIVLAAHLAAAELAEVEGTPYSALSEA